MNRKAFTIAELSISICILVGCVSGIIFSTITFMDLGKLTKNISLASRIASAKLEDIRSESFDDIDAYANQVFYPDTSNLYPQDIAFEDLNYRGIVYVSNISSQLKQVTVVICWRQGQRLIGENWVFDVSPNPSLHAQASSPVTITTLLSNR
ncbi:MAG: hypothetical protein GY858_08375 [Candidatus Omnitrophica bacterium]|nr:hypothetical protein [Candidatus Omnitrophota bacterium]